jgi:hypothetical protein
MHLQPVDLTKVVGDSLEMLKLEIDAREAQVDVEPMPVVRGNAALLTGVFGNLLSNALKYGPRSGGEIQLEHLQRVAHHLGEVDRLQVHRAPVRPRVGEQRLDQPAHLVGDAGEDLEVELGVRVELVARALADALGARRGQHQRPQHLVRRHGGEVLDRRAVLDQLLALALELLDARSQPRQLTLDRAAGAPLREVTATGRDVPWRRD